MRPAVLGSQRYSQVELLGQDELGALWRGTDVRSGSAVTIRVLDERLTADPHAAQRVLARLQRVQWIASAPRLPRMLELRLTERPAVVVYEGSGRETLARHLDRVGALSAPGALRVAAAVADGLASAHQVWVAHGALVASSVLIDDVVVARVVDVGLGDLLERREGRAASRAPGLTDRRAADVLAVGLLFERMISGNVGDRPPPEGDLPLPWERDVPAEARAVLRGALSPHRLHRPGMAELAAGLAPALESKAEDAGPRAAARPHAAAAAGPSEPILPDGPPPPRPDRQEAGGVAPAAIEAASPPAPHEGALRTRRRRRRVALAAIVGVLVAMGGSVGAVLVLRAAAGDQDRPARSLSASPSMAASATPSSAPVIERATVPGILGLRVERATERLREVGLVVGSVTTVPGKAGVVVRTEPTQGEAVASETAVDLFVGNGAEE